MQQCIELTSTNSPFGLTIKFTLSIVVHLVTSVSSCIAHQIPSIVAYKLASASLRLTTLGDPSEGVPPVPIPNTEVKPLSPDGTARASVWESRTSPN